MSEPGPTQQWREALAQGRFLLQRVRASGAVIFPPRIAEPGVGDDDWEWLEAGGLGVVYSATLVHRKPPETPYNVVLVDLDEGPRMMSRVDGVEAGAVRIGMRVQARIIEENGAPLIVFAALP